MNVETAKALFCYDPETGLVTWKNNCGRFGRIPAGSIAGHINGQGYREVRVDRRTYQLHRIAWMIHYGIEAPEFIDHINRNTQDNSIKNLRAATKSANGANRPALSNNKSGVKGCYWVSGVGKWRAQCRVNKRLVNLGYHDSIEAARDAYNKFAADAFGEFHCPA